MRNHAMVTLLASFALAACSGSSGSKGSSEPGISHVSDDLDTDKPDPSGGDAGSATAAENPCGPVGNPCGPGTGDTPAPSSGALVTFELLNSDDVDIEFSYEKGWGLIVSGYSGTPPKATPIFLFPTHCTASCDAADEDRCPVCAKPKGVKEEREDETRQVVKPGERYKLEWDGNVHLYEKTRGKQGKRSKRCKCHRKQKVEPNTYTLRACGIRVTKSAKKTSKYQCVTTEVELPPSAPTVIEFDFGKP